MSTHGQGDFREGGTTTPSIVGGAVPPPPTMLDHSFTLQAVMELQKSTGQLTNAVENLVREINKQDAAIQDLNTKVSGLSHKIYAASVVLGIMVLVGGFFVNKAWDLAVSNLEIRAQSQPVVTNTE